MRNCTDFDSHIEPQKIKTSDLFENCISSLNIHFNLFGELNGAPKLRAVIFC